LVFIFYNFERQKMLTKKGRQPDNPHTPMFSIRIITRNAKGDSVGHREFETPSAGELADWYNRNATPAKGKKRGKN
jgi:hypothetical protein